MLSLVHTTWDTPCIVVHSTKSDFSTIPTGAASLESNQGSLYWRPTVNLWFCIETCRAFEHSMHLDSPCPSAPSAAPSSFFLNSCPARIINLSEVIQPWGDGNIKACPSIGLRRVHLTGLPSTHHLGVGRHTHTTLQTHRYRCVK